MAKGLHKNSLQKIDNPHQWMIDDARMELIQQIKAEIEREREICNDKSVRKKKTNPEASMYYYGKSIALYECLSFLSDLEKEEKPTLQEQPVKIDIRKELASIEFMGVNDARDSETIARHFYELGRQSECVKVKAESALDKFMLENCTHCLIEHCPGVKACYTSSNKQLQ